MLTHHRVVVIAGKAGLRVETGPATGHCSSTKLAFSLSYGVAFDALLALIGRQTYSTVENDIAAEETCVIVEEVGLQAGQTTSAVAGTGTVLAVREDRITRNTG